MKKIVLNLMLFTTILIPAKTSAQIMPDAVEKGQSEMFELLKEWCDALVGHQLSHSSKNIDGGIICPGCGIMHGRAADAIYPLMYMADKTGDTRYIEAARKIFSWGEANVAAPDSAWFNDVNFSSWKGITVFNVIVLGETLNDFGNLLDKPTYDRWLNSLEKQASFVYKMISPGYGNVNYPASACYALTLASEFTNEEKYKTRASELSRFMLDFFTPDNAFVFGEGNPYEKSPKGLSPVDLGYNVEETLPNLMWYADLTDDEALKQKIKQSMDTHIDFMLPDGAWDNSWGTRNFKWSYWGSRTSDGCIAMCHLLSVSDPVYAEVGYRNFELLRQCTHDGLLHGGMHYVSAGYAPCIHHTFEHAKSLALALKRGFVKPEPRLKIPSENEYGAKYFSDLDLWTIATNGWRATVTGYDVDYRKSGGNAHGGTLSMLWNRDAGAIFAAGMTEYTLEEPANMQMRRGMQSYNSTLHVAYNEKGIRYTSIPFKGAKVERRSSKGDEIIVVNTELQTNSYQAPESGTIPVEITYYFRDKETEIKIKANNNAAELKVFIPVISAATEKFYENKGGFFIEKHDCNLLLTYGQGTIKILPVEQNGRAFNPVPGFEFIPFELTFTKETSLKIQIQ